MGITAEKLLESVGRKLTGSHCLLVPDVGNRGIEKTGFLSAEEEAENICKYLESHGITELAMIYGASMGTVVTLRMLSHGEIKAKSLYLDGGAHCEARACHVARIRTGADLAEVDL